MLHFPRESPEREDFVRLLLEHAHDPIHIVDENGVSVFDTASRTGRKQALSPRGVDVSSIVRDTVGMLTPLLRPSIDLRTCLSESPCFAFVDPVPIQQVLVNLAVNARDAMPAGGRIDIGTTLVRLERGALSTGYPTESGSFVRLTCADSGTGMTPDVLSRIFEPFFTTKAEGEGSGLGLPMAYGIVKQSQGEIVVESRPGQGTTLSIYLQEKSDGEP